VILRTGSVPLSVLTQVIDTWIADQKSARASARKSTE
jgi:hypothetical protein